MTGAPPAGRGGRLFPGERRAAEPTGRLKGAHGGGECAHEGNTHEGNTHEGNTHEENTKYLQLPPIRAQMFATFLS